VSPETPQGPFHPVLVMPPDADVLDLSSAEGMTRPRRSPFSIGRYNEARVVYTQDLFGSERTIHMGIDLGGPVGTPVHAFTDCTVYRLGVNGAQGDYGPTIITVQQLDSRPLWTLYGHLSTQSLEGKSPGQSIGRGDVIGWLGAESENGGWPPHVHFQLSWRQPETHDLPGVVSPADRAQALRDYPDPRLILGPIYP